MNSNLRLVIVFTSSALHIVNFSSLSPSISHPTASSRCLLSFRPEPQTRCTCHNGCRIRYRIAPIAHRHIMSDVLEATLATRYPRETDPGWVLPFKKAVTELELLLRKDEDRSAERNDEEELEGDGEEENASIGDVEANLHSVSPDQGVFLLTVTDHRYVSSRLSTKAIERNRYHTSGYRHSTNDSADTEKLGKLLKKHPSWNPYRSGFSSASPVLSSSRKITSKP